MNAKCYKSCVRSDNIYRHWLSNNYHILGISIYTVTASDTVPVGNLQTVSIYTTTASDTVPVGNLEIDHVVFLFHNYIMENIFV